MRGYKQRLINLSLEDTIMGLKNLSQFILFDWKTFATGKTFLTTNIMPWKDFDEPDKILGTKVEVAIIRDATEYKPKKDGTILDNLFDKLVVKIPTTVDIPRNKEVTFEGVVARTYGEYQNNLSIEAKSVQIVQKAKV